MRDTDPVTMTPAQFVTEVVREVPDTRELVAEHLAYYDELLLHLLMFELLEFDIECFGDGRDGVARDLLRFVDRALADGDPDVVNAVAVSFVEDVEGIPGVTPQFLATWPAGLLAEKARQEEAVQRRGRGSGWLHRR